jgi:hypothetical protein
MSSGTQEPEGSEVFVVDLTSEAPVSGQLPSVDLAESEPPSGAGLLFWPLLLVGHE